MREINIFDISNFRLFFGVIIYKYKYFVSFIINTSLRGYIFILCKMYYIT